MRSTDVLLTLSLTLPVWRRGTACSTQWRRRGRRRCRRRKVSRRRRCDDVAWLRRRSTTPRRGAARRPLSDTQQSSPAASQQSNSFRPIGYELGKRFFQRIIKDKSNVLFYLLPAKRDVQLTTRLRRARQYPTTYARINRYKTSFILFGLNHFQWCDFVYAWFSCTFV